MRKVAQFIVRFHKALLALFLVLTVAAACCLPFVTINKDMTVYMPSTMQSKQGTDAMENEFGANSQFRLMINGLSLEQRDDVAKALEDVQGVTSVEYESDGDDFDTYNRGDSAMFKVACDGGTYSDEALGTYAALQEFCESAGYDYYVDSEVIDGIMVDLTGICIFAVILIFFILFVMATSWIEPFLLLGTIGIAVVLNMGSNIFMDSVSEMTFTIAAILQLVLSMDYSIMLMSRFRIERKHVPTKALAMENAIVSGSRAILSSSLTTVVGLACLLLMTFAIGRDMGIVLAKGVILSLICVFAVMPALILMLDKVLDRTAKKPFVPPVDFLATFSFKRKLPVFFAFLAVLALGFGMKGMASATFFLTSYNQDHFTIEETFPAGSQIVVLYDIDDESKVAAAIPDIEAMEGTESVRAYGNTLGKQLSSADMADAMDMDESFIKLIYYHYYKGGEASNLTMNQFARFLKSDVIGNKDYGDQAKDVDASQIDQLIKLTDVSQIQQKRTYSNMASFLGSDAGISSKDMKNLYLFYFMEKGIEPGSLTLPQFVAFLQKDVASNKDFAKYLDKDAMSQINQMAKFANVSNATQKRSSSSMASYLGMDSSQTAQLYKAYALKHGGADLGTMTVGSFIDFIVTDVADSPQYGSMIDAATKQQLQMAKAALPSATLSKSCSPSEMYDVFDGLAKQMAAMGMGDGNSPFSKDTINSLYTYHWALYGDASSVTLSAKTFLAFLCDEIATDPEYSSQFDADALAGLTQVRSIVDATVAGTKFTPKKMADFLGMKSSDVKQLYQYYQFVKKGDGWTISAYDLVKFLVSKKDSKEVSKQMSASDLNSLTTLKSIMAGAIAGKTYSPSALSSELKSFGGSDADMSASDLELVYLLYASKNGYDKSWTMCIYDFVNYVADDILNDDKFASSIKDKDRADLLDARKTLEDAKDKLLGKTWGMMVVAASYDVDSQETFDYIAGLEDMLRNVLNGDHFLVGKAPMALDMSADFLGELNFISLITALAIFLIVALTFKSLVIPLVLVLLIQTAFGLTMGLSGIVGGGTYYVALIIVQALLMGATIDYAILFVTNYRAARIINGVKESLGIAYRQSISTILTSGSILVSATFCVGMAQLGTATSQVCLTIAEGSTFAILLVILILPGVVCFLDKWMAGKGALQK